MPLKQKKILIILCLLFAFPCEDWNTMKFSVTTLSQVFNGLIIELLCFLRTSYIRLTCLFPSVHVKCLNQLNCCFSIYSSTSLKLLVLSSVLYFEFVLFLLSVIARRYFIFTTCILLFNFCVNI